MCYIWTAVLYALLLALGAFMSLALAAYIRPTMHSAEAAIGKIDRMYADLQAILRVACGTAGLLPPDLWPLVCNSSL